MNQHFLNHPVSKTTCRSLAVSGVLLALAGCSSWEQKEDYLSAKESAPLQIPPGLDVPNTQAQLVIPPSHSSKSFKSPEPPKLKASAATMAQASRVVERGGAWVLDLESAPDAAYPLLATALERGGYPILRKNPEAFSYEVRAAKDGLPVDGGAVRRFFKRLALSDVGAPVTVVLSANPNAGSELRVASSSKKPMSARGQQTLLEQLAERLK